MKTPLTKERIRQHWHYSAWKYILAAILIVFGWDLIFTMTAYHSPAELIVDTYVYGVPVLDELQAYVNKVHSEQMSDMESMNAQSIIQDATYGSMILMTRFAAGEGDLYMLPRAEFQNYAGENAFVQLDEVEGLAELLESNGRNPERGIYRNSETGERHLYGIPGSCLPGMQKILGTNTEYYLCVVINNGNEENTMKLLKIMVNDWVTDVEATQE